MIKLIVNNGQFEINCKSFKYGYGRIPPMNGSYLVTPPDYLLALEFEGDAPKEVHTMALTGMIADSILIQPNENLPVGLEFLYVLVDSIDQKMKIGEKILTVVNMRALRITTVGKTIFGDIKVKKCITCGREIHYNYVMTKMSGWLSPIKVFKLWNSDLIDFYCCVCYKKWCMDEI